MNILEKLTKTSLKFLGHYSLEQVYKMIISEAMALVGVWDGALYTEEENQFVVKYSTDNAVFKNEHAKTEGFLNEAFKTCRSFIVNIGELGSRHKKLHNIGIKSVIYIPLSYKGKSIGVMALLSKRKKTFTDQELKGLELFGSLASLSIRKTQLHYETQKAIQERDKSISLEVVLERLNKVFIQFLEPLSIEDTYRLIADEVIKLSKAKYATIHIEKKEILERVYCSTGIFKKIKIRKKGFTYRCFHTNKIIIAYSNQMSKIHPIIQRFNIKSTVFIPLSNNNKSVGVLSLDYLTKESFNQEKINIFKIMGSIFSLAIKKSHLYNELKKSLELRDLFISIAAHELRTPITTINGYIQLLHNKIEVNKSPESRWISHLMWESKRLTELVNELLEINRIKSGQLQYMFRECNLREIVNRAYSNFLFSFPKREIVLEDKIGKESDKIIGDFDKLQQVVLNLLDNAAKFSQSNSKIIITIASNSRFLTILVRDYGQGIAKEEIPKVVQGFYRSKDVEREGMGLGLYLVKNIIKFHRGSMEIHSKINKGTTIEINFPKDRI